MERRVLQERLTDAIRLYKKEEDNFFAAAFAYESAKRKVEKLKADSCYYRFDYSWMEDDVKKLLIIREQGFDKQYDIAIKREEEAKKALETARNVFNEIPFDIIWKKRELLDLRYYFAELMYKQAEHAYALAKAKYTYHTVRLRAMRKSEMYKSEEKVCQKAEKDFCEARRSVDTARVKYEKMKARSDMMSDYLGWRASLDGLECY